MASREQLEYYLHPLVDLEDGASSSEGRQMHLHTRRSLGTFRKKNTTKTPIEIPSEAAGRIRIILSLLYDSIKRCFFSVDFCMHTLGFLQFFRIVELPSRYCCPSLGSLQMEKNQARRPTTSRNSRGFS